MARVPPLSDVSMSAPAPVTALRSAYVVFMFFLCFVFSYVDRQIVSILVQPLKATLHLSDTQIGMLQGIVALD